MPGKARASAPLPGHHGPGSGAAANESPGNRALCSECGKTVTVSAESTLSQHGSFRVTQQTAVESLRPAICQGSGQLGARLGAAPGHAVCVWCEDTFVVASGAPLPTQTPAGAATAPSGSLRARTDPLALCQALAIGQCFTSPSSGVTIQLRKRIPHADWDDATKDRWDTIPVQQDYYSLGDRRWCAAGEPPTELWAYEIVRRYVPRVDWAAHYHIQHAQMESASNSFGSGHATALSAAELGQCVQADLTVHRGAIHTFVIQTCTDAQCVGWKYYVASWRKQQETQEQERQARILARSRDNPDYMREQVRLAKNALARARRHYNPSSGLVQDKERELAATKAQLEAAIAKQEAERAASRA